MGFQKLLSQFSFIAVFVFLSTSLGAWPGMWPYNMLPLDHLKELGFEPTEEWIKNLQFSSVRINAGGSGSFTSAYGLVSTNHHVAVSALSQISTAENDYLKNGHTAQSLEEEIAIPNYEVNVLQGIDDVTELIKGVEKEGMSGWEIKKARERAIAELEETIFQESGETSQVISLFNGRFYHLYRYKRYTDVRLVWAPENQAGFFGGDEANFEYPRHVLDVALFRVYDADGTPLDTPNFVPWSQHGSREGELLFVSGHPGSTDRYLSSAALRFEQNIYVPLIIEIIQTRITMLKDYAARGQEQARQAKDLIFGLENAMKVYSAMAENLRGQNVIGRRQAEEEELVSRAEELGRAVDVRSALQAIAESRKLAEEFLELSLLTGRLGLNSDFFGKAMTLVNYAEEIEKDNLDREKPYRDANLESTKLALFSSKPIYPELEEAKLIQSLNWLIARLGVENEVIAIILDGKSIEDRAAELAYNTTLADVGVRKSLFEGRQEAVEASKDPWIVLARALKPRVDEIEKKIADAAGRKEANAYQSLFQIREQLGEVLAPDATFSLRMSYGIVEGYTEFGLPLPAYTNIGQAFDQAEARAGEEVWTLPESWDEALASRHVDLTAPLNFVSSHDTTGGNSGSPMVNANGEWVGILFDGNRHGVGAEKYNPPTGLSRSLSVDCRGALAAMRGIYPAQHLVNELTIGAKPYL